ncbi:MAG: hypothetical protein CM15mP103_00250 [Gammaproteobacteria bacterium]|nr:MAG: hypothetical protein CM15mP103_00250 [Gammaproteobacteria bacterium]
MELNFRWDVHYGWISAIMVVFLATGNLDVKAKPAMLAGLEDHFHICPENRHRDFRALFPNASLVITAPVKISCTRGCAGNAGVTDFSDRLIQSNP